MVGRHEDVEMAGYLFSYLVHELERLQGVFGKERWDDLRAYASKWGISTHEAEQDYSAKGEHPLRSKQSWMIGAVESVIGALIAAKRERDSRGNDTAALVVDKRAGIKDYFAQKAGFRDYAHQQAEIEKRQAEWSARYDAQQSSVPVKPEKAKTPPQLRREAEANQRANDRYWDAQERKRAREAAKIDANAYYRGKADGSSIGLRPGLKGGK